MNWLIQSLQIGLIVISIPVSLLLWTLGLDRVLKGEALIPWTPRRQVPWTLLHLLAIGFAGFSLSVVSFGVVQLFNGDVGDALAAEELPPGQELTMIIVFAVTTVLTCAFGTLILRYGARADLVDLGLSPRRLSEDVKLGVIAFIMLVVPMLAIQLLAVMVFPTKEQHPFIDLVIEEPRLSLLIPIAIVAVVVAPLVEEFLFRLVLQGWLEGLNSQLRSSLLPENGPAEMVAELRPDDGLDDQDTCLEPHEDLEDRQLECDDLDEQRTATSWWPILVSGVIFGLAHMPQFPAPIALTFLGVGLGYLYQRTHRIIPCIVVHMLVNLLAVAQLGLYIAQHAAT